MYIAVEGVIGVGKTTLARLLQPAFEAQLLLEEFEEDSYFLEENMLAKIIPHNYLWVIEQAKIKAESIMNAPRRIGSDQQTINWLTLARNAYYYADDIQGWKNYCQNLTDIYGHKKYINERVLKPMFSLD